MKKLLFLFMIIGIGIGATAQEKQKSDMTTVLTKQIFKDSITGHDVQLIDVRTPEEFSKGHIKNAKNIDFLEPGTFTEKFQKLKKDRPLYIYCRSGNRSGQASKKLEQMGFQEIYDLDGGYLNWQK